MLERRFAAKTCQLLERFEPDFLDDVLDFAVAAGVTAGGGENPRRILGNERLEARGVTFQHRGNEFRIGSFHVCAEYDKQRAVTEAKSSRHSGSIDAKARRRLQGLGRLSLA